MCKLYIDHSLPHQLCVRSQATRAPHTPTGQEGLRAQAEWKTARAHKVSILSQGPRQEDKRWNQTHPKAIPCIDPSKTHVPEAP